MGGSERCVRELFREAEEELAVCKLAAGPDDQMAFLNSALHVVVIDEIDAVFRKRIEDRMWLLDLGGEETSWSA